MKKRIISILMTAVIVFSFTVTAMAALSTSPTATANAIAKVKTTPTSKATTTVATASVKQTYTVTLSKLFVRSGAGTSYSKLGILTQGTKVTGVVTKGWLKFTYKGKIAYCSANYLKTSSTTAKAKTTPTSKATTTVATTNIKQTYMVTLSKLFIRSGAGTSYSKLGVLTKGTKVTGVVTKGWLKFTYKGKTAYCSASYLKTSSTTAKVKTTPTSKTTTTVATTNDKQTYTVTLSKLFVRSGAGTTYSKLGVLTKGTKVTGVVTKGWLKFAYKGKTAYCSASYLK